MCYSQFYADMNYLRLIKILRFFFYLTCKTDLIFQPKVLHQSNEEGGGPSMSPVQ